LKHSLKKGWEAKTNTFSCCGTPYKRQAPEGSAASAGIIQATEKRSQLKAIAGLEPVMRLSDS